MKIFQNYHFFNELTSFFNPDLIRFHIWRGTWPRKAMAQRARLGYIHLMTSDSDTLTRLEAELLRLTAERGAGATACPSEAARNISGPHPDQWGPLMQPVRKIAVRLANEGRLVITRKGKPVDPNDFRGVYRVGAPRID